MLASAVMFIFFNASVGCLLRHMQHVSSSLLVYTADGCECVQAYGHTMDFTRMVHLLRASWSAPSSAKPNLLTYNAAISVCSRVGQLGRAIRLLHEMVRLQCLSYTFCASFLAPSALLVRGWWRLFVCLLPTQKRCGPAQQCIFASGKLVALLLCGMHQHAAGATKATQPTFNIYVVLVIACLRACQHSVH